MRRSRAWVRASIAAMVVGSVSMLSMAVSAQFVYRLPIPINVGDDWQTAINAAPTGQRFLIRTGTHRQQSVAPKNGQQFMGQAGSVMSGAKLLPSTVGGGGWTADGGSRWYLTGQTQQGYQGYVGLNICQAASDNCAYPEDLWIDGVLKVHERPLGSLGAGEWHFDYAADRIYVGDDPTGHVIEASVSTDAFHGAAVSVVIQHLTIEKYAAYPQHGMVDGDSGQSWVVQNNTIRSSHAVGVRIHSNMRLVSNNIHSHGQMGIGGGGTDALVENNTIALNNSILYQVGFEAGGTKFVGTTRLIVRGNYAHDNAGLGLWTDINNRDCVFDNNIVDDNAWAGIMHEISFACRISGNTIRRNGLTHPNVAIGGKKCFVADAGIFIAASANVEVYGNYLEGNADGICAIQQNRSADETAFGEAVGSYRVRGLNVHDNYIASAVTSGTQGIGISADYLTTEVVDLIGTYEGANDPIEVRQPAGTGYNNRFECNHYYLNDGNAATAWWLFIDYTNFANWQAFGHDLNSGTACAAGGDDGTYATFASYVPH